MKSNFVDKIKKAKKSEVIQINQLAGKVSEKKNAL